MINELIARVFRARDFAHLQHWETDSYAEHMALGDFYEGVVEQLDTLIEAYQATFGRVSGVKLLPVAKGEALKVLQDDAVWIAKNRSKIAGSVLALESIVDELTALYLGTIYKLKFLK